MNKPVFFVSLSFCAGIFIGYYSDADILISAFLLLLSFLTAVFLRLKKQLSFRYVLIIFIFLGIFLSSYKLGYRPVNNIKKLDSMTLENCEKVLIKVESIPDDSPKTSVFIGELIEIMGKEKKVSGINGRIKVTVIRKVNTVFYYGDILEIKGRLLILGKEKNEKRFYGAGIDAVIKADDTAIRVAGHKPNNFFMDLSQKARVKMTEVIYACVPFEQARLCEGLLMGSQRMVSDEVYESFIRTGTVHILAVSGANVAVICITALVFLGFAGINKKIASVIAAVSVWVFCCSTGASESVVRASIMATFILAGSIAGRDIDTASSLSLAAFFTAVVSPLSVLTYSFQMSYLAAFGIIYMSDWLDKKFIFISGYIRPVFTSTIAAQLFVMPVIINGFGRLSVISFVANLLIVPIASLITVSGFFMWIAGFLSIKAGMIFGASCWFLSKLLVTVNSLFAAAPWAVIETSAVTPVLYLPYYAALLTMPHDDIDLFAGKISLKKFFAVLAFAFVLLFALSNKKPLQNDIIESNTVKTKEGKWK